MRTKFLKALDSFIEALSRKDVRDVDQWRKELSGDAKNHGLADKLNELTFDLAREGVPNEWVFSPYLDFFRREIYPRYLTRQPQWPPPTAILQGLREFSKAFGGKATAKKRNRARNKPKKFRPLTARQTETAQIVAQCNGNIAEAARRLGKDRKTVVESYKAAMAKIGMEAVRSRDKTCLLPRDKRGNVTISSDDDRRL